MTQCFYCGSNCRATTIYVISEETSPPTVKVGYASNPKKRLTQIRKKTGRDLGIIHCVRAFCEFKAMEIEDAAHKALAFFWDRGEWFTCSPETAAIAVDKAAKRLGLRGKRL